ncbi:hypothetical protein Hanom_Chr14g01318401 [Helianthus anomalus]
MSKISPDPTMVWSVKVVETRSTLQDQSIQPKITWWLWVEDGGDDTKIYPLVYRSTVWWPDLPFEVEDQWLN